ncbi:DUF4435 domain-containing protein [Herpetosiphon gulosus]|uniref:DUF4435 domain-containing protein n=1 Tax=Herpetosiphon gulosus TaxID=1973496 RepID=A0ABP9WWQ0_9CHLR
MTIPMKINEYPVYIKFSSYKKHLLVEGSSDWNAFKKIIHTISEIQEDESIAEDIFIDTAEMFSNSGNEVHGNRMKVELACKLIEEKISSGKVLGFVDREFRNFTIDSKITDEINKHYRDGIIIWSRGHSIENYLFNIRILKSVFQDITDTRYRYDASIKFNKIFASILVNVCILSFVCCESDNIDRTSNQITFNCFNISDDKISFNMEIFVENLRNNGFSIENIQKIKDSFDKYQNIVHNTDPSVLRWICHGHVGINLLWVIFAQCVYNVCLESPQTEANKALMPKKDLRFKQSISTWITYYLQDQEEFPVDVVNFILNP